MESPPHHTQTQLSEAILTLILPLTGCAILGKMFPPLGPGLLSIGWILNLGSPMYPFWWGGDMMYKEPCSK